MTPETCEMCHSPVRLEVGPARLDSTAPPKKKTCALHLGDVIFDLVSDGAAIREWVVRVL